MRAVDRRGVPCMTSRHGGQTRGSPLLRSIVNSVRSSPTTPPLDSEHRRFGLLRDYAHRVAESLALRSTAESTIEGQPTTVLSAARRSAAMSSLPITSARTGTVRCLSCCIAPGRGVRSG